MKIGFFVENYYSGGIDSFIINLINNWPNKSDALCLISNKTNKGLDYIKESLTRPCSIIAHDIPVFTGYFQFQTENNIFRSLKLLALRISAPILRYFMFYKNISLFKTLFTCRLIGIFLGLRSLVNSAGRRIKPASRSMWLHFRPKISPILIPEL